MIQLRPVLRLVTLVSVLLFSLALSRNAEAGAIDDCGYLFLSTDGCLLFAPDNHPGAYRLTNYGTFEAGNRVHVDGEHDAECFGPCESSCIKYNSISEGCSQLCSDVPYDANNDGRMNIGDVVQVVQYIFTGYQNFTCLEQADCNLNNKIEVGDLTCMLSILF